MKTIPKISEREFLNTKNSDDPWDLLFLISDKYFKIAASDPTREILKQFNRYQHTLLAFNYLYGEVNNGGFIQLIQNGYGKYIFDNPFIESLRVFGACNTADVIEKAKKIYTAKRTALEKETTLKEFSELYKKHPEFEQTESEFHLYIDNDTQKIKEFILANPNKFFTVT
jgi:hypothetical protein